MAYGTIKVDTITFTDGGVDKSVSVSGLVENPTFTGNVTATGTISGDIVRGQTISGVTVTGTTANFTSGNFTNISGGTHTITSGVFASGTAANPSISFVSDPNSGLYSPGADQVAISTNGTGRLFVDASGRILAGASSARTKYANKAQIETTGSESSYGLTTIYNANDAFGAAIAIGKSRGTSVGSVTVVQSGDQLGSIQFIGTDGVDQESAASIDAFVDGTPGSNDMPGRLVFSTTADGSASPTERMRLDSSGRLGLGTSSPTSRLTIKQANDADSTAGTALEANGNDSRLLTYFNTSQDAWITTATYGSTGAFKPLSFWTSDTRRLTIDTSGRVGIGTTAATERLSINDSGANAAISIRTGGASFNSVVKFNADDTNYAGIGLESTALVMRCSNSSTPTERARIDSSGRLGLGTSSVGALLHANQTTAGDNVLRLTGNYSSSGTSPLIVFERAGGAVAGHLRYNDAFNAMQIGTTSAHRFDLYTNSNTALTIDSSQRVGIGTTSPTNALHVNSGATGTSTILESTGSGSYLGIKNSSGQWTLGATSTSFILENSGGEALRVDGSRRLLVGTSSSSASAAAVFQGFAGSATGQGIIQLQVGKNTAATAVNENLGSVRFANSDGNIGALISGEADLQWDSGDYPSRLVFSVSQDGSASPTERIRLENAGRSLFFSSGNGIAVGVADGAGTTTELFAGIYSRTSTTAGGSASIIIYSNGNVVNTNNSYGSLSDIKLKENIVDANSQWDDLKALQVRNYNFKEGQTHTQIGLVAQEVELVSPGLVSESPDRDEEGNDLGTVTKSVNYSVLYMKAVKALQEAMERIETLEAKVAALEAQ